MPAQDRVGGDQAMTPQRGAAAARGRRTRPGPPGPGVVVGWCGAGWQPRGAARGARCPWWRTCGPAVGPIRAPDRRSSIAAAATRRDQVRPAIAAVSGQARVLAPHRAKHALALGERLLVERIGARVGPNVSLRLPYLIDTTRANDLSRTDPR